MTKKDYELVARCVKRIMDDAIARPTMKPDEALTMFSAYFSSFAQDDNPRFCKKRFLEACGVK